MSAIPPEEDEDLRRLFQANDGAGLDDGSDPDAIWDAVSGTAAPEDLRETLASLRASPALRQEWRLAQAFRAELGEEIAATPRARRPRRLVTAAVLLMAAAALLMLRPPPETRWRDSSPTAPIASTLPGDALSLSDPLLTWTDLGAQVTYTVTVTDAQLSTVAFAPGLTEPQWRIPSESIADLPGGTVLLWRVEATLPDGTRRASATQQLTLESSP